MNDTTSGMTPIPVPDLLARLGEKEVPGHEPAWQLAWTAGTAAVRPLLRAMADADTERARSAVRALWNIVEHSTAPERKEVRAGVKLEITSVLETGASTVPVARELLWMLSIVGEDDAVANVARYLDHAELREDARCVLQRIPGSGATSALKAALKSASGDFASALADALRGRGETIREHPSVKKAPSRVTMVGKVG